MVCFCIPVYLHTCLCVFGHVSRINNSEPSSLSDLGTLKVMTRNLFSRSILQKTHNFLAKGKIISPCSSVSFERGGRKRYIKKHKKQSSRNSIQKVARHMAPDQASTVNCCIRIHQTHPIVSWVLAVIVRSLQRNTLTFCEITCFNYLVRVGLDDW